MEVTGKDYSTSRKKVCIAPHCPLFSLFLMLDQVLARDGFRCIITGMFNSGSLKKSAALRDMAPRES